MLVTRDCTVTIKKVQTSNDKSVNKKIYTNSIRKHISEFATRPPVGLLSQRLSSDLSSLLKLQTSSEEII